MTDFVVVSHPTVVSVEETQKLVKSLHADGIEVEHIVLNMLVDAVPTDRFSDVMFRLQQKQIMHAEDMFAHKAIVKVDHQLQEPRGLFLLRHMAENVFSGNEGSVRSAKIPPRISSHPFGPLSTRPLLFGSTLR